MNREPCHLAVLVTGASGFLGQAIVQQWHAVKCDLRTTGRRLTPPVDLPNYTAADLTDWSAVCRIVSGIDVVIHAAGLAHQHRAGQAKPADFLRTNSEGTANVARAAAAAGCRRFILVSSVSVYGSGWPPKTEAAPCLPATDYARSKLDAERRAAEIAATSGMELVVLRLATLYGENDPGNVGRLLRAIARERFVWIGRGENPKSLVHVEDAARACIMAALHPHLPPVAIYNVSAEPCTMRAIVTTLASSLRRRPPSWWLPPAIPRRLATVLAGIAPFAARGHHWGATLEKWLSQEVYPATAFQEALSWCARVSLKDGLARQVAAYQRTQQKAVAPRNFAVRGRRAGTAEAA